MVAERIPFGKSKQARLLPNLFYDPKIFPVELSLLKILIKASFLAPGYDKLVYTVYSPW
jgi:hypothetical protein